MSIEQGINFITNNGLAVFLVIWWIFWGSKSHTGMIKAFNNMNDTLLVIKEFFEKFINEKNE